MRALDRTRNKLHEVSRYLRGAHLDREQTVAILEELEALRTQVLLCQLDPAPPPEPVVLEVVTNIRRIAEMFQNDRSKLLTLLAAADILERFGAPVPGST